MNLSETWFLEGYIDFELQKYRLLSYLQEVNNYFTENKLYPKLADVVFHYNNIVSFRDKKQLMQDQFPKQLDQVNLQKLELVYKQMLADDDIMKELEDIIYFASEQMKQTLDTGAEIYELVEKQLYVAPVGIMPLYKDEGYMLLRYGNMQEVRAYAYNVTLFEHQAAKYRGIKVSYVNSWEKTVANTYEQIKREIVKTIRTLPNPAVFCIESPWQVPLDETLLPIAKRVLVRHIATA
jgi:hypothetical protein